jgi:hypothetical protein
MTATALELESHTVDRIGQAIEMIGRLFRRLASHIPKRGQVTIRAIPRFDGESA